MTRWLVHCFISTFALFAVYLYLISAQYDYPIAKPSTSWTNNISDPRTVKLSDGSTVRIILQRKYGTDGVIFGCGFICKGTCNSNYLFAVFVVIVTDEDIEDIDDDPPVLWSANHNNPVGVDATVEFTSDGDLILRNGSSLVWSTNSGGKSVAGINLTDTGNLVLFSVNNLVVWQSFDHPTDTLLLGQKLFPGQKLTSFLPVTNDVYHTLRVTDKVFGVYIESGPPEGPVPYLTFPIDVGLNYIIFLNGSLSLIFVNSSDNLKIPVPAAYSTTTYIRLGSDGHLRVFDSLSHRSRDYDLWSNWMDDCEYPMACGRYGICSRKQCFCPKLYVDGTNYFEAISDHQPNIGCSGTLPLTCNASEYHKVLKLENVSYFAFHSDIKNTDLDHCKNVCLRNCSCKAAIFKYLSNSLRGNCYLPSSIFSLIYTNQKLYTSYSSLVFIKVQSTSLVHHAKGKKRGMKA